MIKKIIYFLIELIEKYEYRNLSLDENDINKKILNTISGLNLKVKTDTGYEKATDIHLTQPYRVYEIELDNGYKLECADNHILFDINFNQIFCIDLTINSYIQTDIGLSKVIKISKSKQRLSMFDLTINHPNHRFYTNGILSHNTINSAITILHFITFNNDKNVMIVANLRDTTIEIIDKIKNIYINLPFFLKVGIRNWNQKSMVCENGCRIKSAARSRTPAIGFSIDFLYLDEFAHIPSNIIEPYYTAVYPTLAGIANSKMIITSTPKGMNLFYKLLMAAKLPDSDPNSTKFVYKEVYWHQVEGRFVTYFRLQEPKLFQYGITKEELFEQVKETFSHTKVTMEFIADLDKHVINIFNSESCTDEDVKKFTFIKGDISISIQHLAYVTTWKEETIKEIGGEDQFNQEFALRFVDGSRSLLNEAIINGLMKNKKDYLSHSSYEFDRRLRFSYDDLKFIDDDEVFMPINRNKISGVISVDISGGLGEDYSVINMFKIAPKSMEVIEMHKKSFTCISDFFSLVQFGIYRSNLVSIQQLAEIFYVLQFEYFNPEKFKTVLEINYAGGEFIEKVKNCFDGENDYASNVFFKYKHRIDAEEEKIGLKVTSTKDTLIKDYQTAMVSQKFIINNEITIDEITTFVKQVTSAGNIRYAADTGHDDCVMTIVDAATVFSKFIFKEMVEDCMHEVASQSQLAYFYSILKNQEGMEPTNSDYNNIININKQKRFVNQYKNNRNFFN